MSAINPDQTTQAMKSVDDYLREFPTSTDPKAAVFLGGACNPTVWRFAEAIPALEKAKVSYFNPQVREWTEDLIGKEDEAKENAKVLLFVIDHQTRGVASMVEACEYVSLGKPTVLVIVEIAPGAVIDGEPIGPNQLKDLNRGRKYLADTARQHSVPVFDKIPDAVKQIIAMAHE